jgi:hypothetical protein
MLNRLIVSACAALLFIPSPCRGQHYQIDVTLFRGDPKGSQEAGTLKRISTPTLVSKSGEGASLLVGGQIPVGKRFVPFGTQVHVTPKDLGHGAIHLTLTLERIDRIGPASSQVNVTSASTKATVQSGGKLRLELDEKATDKLWVEITISKVK